MSSVWCHSKIDLQPGIPTDKGLALIVAWGAATWLTDLNELHAQYCRIDNSLVPRACAFGILEEMILSRQLILQPVLLIGGYVRLRLKPYATLLSRNEIKLYFNCRSYTHTCRYKI